ncbi:radical SAM/SPASM domain-containing protein [Streptomyces sp. NBC_01477]|uniref:radical SAM/SPASM domain-containing protein n=1 Tax=Streptomyces sp. NBC_01477 TaxID=2976015 RepID=UPI002E3476B0|nr:radical SAM/SPASM domain-containing protein [Streptomyces sp. NBC_01477]
MLPATLQTSPYITCIRPDEPSPVIYMTDTRGPAFPVITDPGDAAFGVIGLDRTVDWQPDLAALAALERAAPEPVDLPSLIAEFGEPLIRRLVEKAWLQASDDLCVEYRLRTAQIEVTAHCNWSCRYCPVSSSPKPRATMPMDLFTEIIEKLTPYRTITFVTFHFFNEPTLDRFFADRIRVLQEHGMKLSLSTNASALTHRKIQLLQDSGVLHHLIVNLPTLDEEEFRTLTGAGTYKATLRNLDLAIDQGWPVTLAVNGVGEELSRRTAALRAKYEGRGVEVNPTQTCDRAGELTNEYHQGVFAAGRLRGCSWPLNHAYFSVTGDMFICCNDFHQREVYGNIRDGSVHDVMTSPDAVRLRRRVFGVEEAPQDYICRTCHDQKPDFVHRQFRPLASFPVLGPLRPEQAR